MNFGDIRGPLDKIISQLVRIARNTDDNACCESILTGGTTSPIPAGFTSVRIEATSGGPVITFADSTTYTMANNEVLILDTKQFQKLPEITIAGGTFKWIGFN